ncbi:MAG: hypothetical protein IK121_06695 [Lachnospiraceae bacterium]|nr:hypothetical protein [Lachnospiraceae bacterium]
MKKICLTITLILLALSMTACKKIKVFETQEDTSGIATYKKSNLKNGLVYVKDGAIFMLPSEMEVVNGSYFYYKGFSDIPTLYKGEVLVYADDEKSSFSSLELKRLKSEGYTFGVYNGNVNSKGEYSFRDTDVLKSALAYSVFPHNDKTITIITLDGKPLTKEMAVNGVLGTNTGFEPNSEHPIACYIGTHYYEGTITNDVFTLTDFEAYSLKAYEKTKNGYIQFTMNSDMKSGYYYLENQGIIRYVAEEKKSVENLYDIDYYEPLYSTTSLVEKDVSENDIPSSKPAEEPNKVQTYSVPINEKKYDFVFTVNYDVSGTKPSIVLVSPTGATYVLKEEREGLQSITLAEVAIGEWKIVINDPTLKVLNIGATKKDEVVATKEVSKTFEVTEIKSSQKVTIEYTGVILNAYVVDQNNEVTIITPKKQGVYEYTFDFMEAGTYKVYVVCTEDSDIIEIKMEDCSNYETEIIVVE